MGNYWKTRGLNRPLLQLILSDEAAVSHGWRKSATAAELKRYYNDVHTNNTRIRERKAPEPTAEMFLRNQVLTNVILKPTKFYPHT